MLDHLTRDTRTAFRAFTKNPGFTLTAVLTIALGMGVNTSLFTVMHAVLFRPLPVRDADGLKNVYVMTQGDSPRSSYESSAFVSFVEFEHLRRQSTTSDIAAISAATVSWRGLPGRAVRAQLVSDNLLPMIGARPLMGRFFTPDETARPGSAPVVVLGHGFWQRQLGGDSAIVGKPVTLNRTLFTVIGVADEATRGPLIQVAEVWIPITMQRLTRPGESLVDDPNAGFIQLFARKRAGATDAKVLAEMRVLGPQAVATHDSVRRAQVDVVPGAFMNFGERNQALPALALIWVAVALILLVACANVANMLLARGLSRQREMSIRLAIGAARGRLIRQLLTESAWLGVLGGALGLSLAFGLSRLVLSAVPATADVQLDLTPDRSVLLFTLIASIVSGLAFGLLPALQATRQDLSPGLKTEGLLAAGRPKARLQHALVGLQVAGCVVLLVNAGLVIRSFNLALHLDVGKPLDHLLISGFDLRQQQYTPELATDFFRRVSERIDGLPYVVASGASILTPEISSAQSQVTLGDSAASQDQAFRVGFDEVGAGYFATAGLRTLVGRTFTEQEVKTGAPVVVVDQRFADRMGGKAVGHQIWLGGMTRRAHEIVGVVNSTRPLGFTADQLPTYFTPIGGLRYLEAKLWVRYRGEPGPAMAAIREAAREIDAEVGPSFRTIEENVREVLMPVRITSWSLTALGALSLALASVGLFGVIAFSVGRRAREIAIRMALGAESTKIVGLVFRQSARPVALGLVVGLALAVAGGHLIRAMLYGLSPFDPLAIGGVVALIAAATGLAFWIPARRATSVQPSALLRVD